MYLSGTFAVISGGFDTIPIIENEFKPNRYSSIDEINALLPQTTTQ